MILLINPVAISFEDLDLLTRRQLFRKFNLQPRSNIKCSVNNPCFNNDGKLLAMRCNCGNKVYHPVIGDVIIWDQIISPKTLATLKKLPINKALSILQAFG